MPPLHETRLRWIAGLLLLAFVGLVGRLAYLQFVREDELTQAARGNTRRDELLHPRRGQILDARGELLAASQIVKTVVADPHVIGNQQAPIARAIAPLLGLDPEDLRQRLQPGLIPRTNLVPIAPGSTVFTNVVTNVPLQYVVLKRHVPVETWERVRDTMAKLDFGYDEKALPRSQRQFLDRARRQAISVDRQDDQIRVYPQGRFAAHVLGHTTHVETRFSGRPDRELVGVQGIERQFNRELTGQRGWRVIVRDKRGVEVVDQRHQDVAPVDGLNVHLTLDTFIQHELENALADALRKHTPVSVAGVVVRPRTGDILAMAVLPDFDPNAPGRDLESVAVLRNRLIADMHEPGSTFKAPVIAASLDAGVTRLSDVIHCENGTWFYAGRTLRDVRGHGPLTVEQIVTRSSNIGAAKIALRMGNTNLWQYLDRFGFGQRTGIELPGEVRGWLKAPHTWHPLTITRVAMGHEVTATPLQVVMAMAAIANDGVLMRPRLVTRLQDGAGQVAALTEPRPVRRVVSPEAARQITLALKTVPAVGGTARGAALDHYSVAGKTGTAEKAGPGGVGYITGKHFSSFVGFFPADQPELCIGIFLDEPKEGHLGGQVAGPVFRQLAERVAAYLNIPPDRPAPETARAATPADNATH